MASNEDKEHPDPNSREGGGSAHNTTLDVLDGRLPGGDQTSNLGQILRGPSSDQLPGGDPRNRETHQEAGDQLSVAGVLDRTLAVRLRMGVPQTTLTTLDKAISEGLVALDFGDMEAAACLLLLPQGESILEELRKLLKNPGVEHSHPSVRHLVGVWLGSSAI